MAVDGDAGRLARPLDAMGVAVGPENPTLAVVVCADYLEEAHHAVNRRHIASGAPWMLVRPRGMRPLFGPVFRPAERGPCWACLAYRLRGHQEVHDFLRGVAGDDAAFLPRAAEPALVDAVYGLVAAEIAKWLVLPDMAPIHERAISLDTGRLTTEHHPAARRPQCSGVRRRGAVSPRSTAGSGAASTEAGGRPQQRRSAFGAAPRRPWPGTVTW